jgi:glycosyltransferase involved in cell wall biosynthesis
VVARGGIVAPRVTFVVPVYNGGAYFGETLASLLAQTSREFRIVVLDNVSTDGSAELAESLGDGRVEVVRATEHVSMTENWNRAVALVETEYFVLAHADDVYEPEYLESMLPTIERFPKAVFAHCLITTIDGRGRKLAAPNDRYKEAFWPKEDPYERNTCEALSWLVKGNYISAPSPIYRTSAVRAVGPFETKYLFVPDWAYWVAGALAGFTIVGTRRRLVRYRRHDASLTTLHNSSLRSFREYIELLAEIAAAGRKAGCFADDRPNFGIVVDTMSSEFAELLAAGRTDSARTLLEFGEAEIPGFRGGVRDRVLRAGLATGRLGGRALASVRNLYLARLR